MKKSKYFLLSLMVALMLAACEKDGDIIAISDVRPVELTGSGDVVINKDCPNGLALTLNWTDNSRLKTSDERVQTPVGTTVNTLQFSSTSSFDDVIEILTDAGVNSMQFTAEKLNALVGRVGLESDVASSLFIRMQSVLASNVEPLYSNVYQIMVTPYSIDMSIGYVLDAARNDTGFTLASENSDGIYRGFIGAGSWYNWWLQEGNGVLWGNVGDDGGGKAFIISSNDQHWNFWYPGQSGCYYTVVNTIRQEWSALYIPSLSVSGDISGEMSYDRKSNKWSMEYHASQAGSVSIRIAGTGKLYDANSGTEDGAAVDTPVAFGFEGGKLTFGERASDITVDIPSAGDLTISLDLSNPKAWKCEAVEGGDDPSDISPVLYILGNDDTWNFDQYLTLYDEDNLCYAAVVNFNCSYGYYFSRAKDDWTHINQDPNSFDKKLIVGGSDADNIVAPGKGLFVTIASLGWMSYWYGMDDPVTRVSYTGFNDVWDLTDMVPVEGKPGVYTAQVTATGNTPWGAQIVLNGSWDYWFGTCSDGLLRWTKKDNGNPVGWETGKTYTITVDLCKCTYSITEQ